MRSSGTGEIILSAVLACSSAVAFAEGERSTLGCQSLLLGGERDLAQLSSPFIYHFMPRLIEGGLPRIQQELNKLKGFGVNTLWLGPVHPQTLDEHWYRGADGQMYRSANDHGYWVANHQAVDERLGGVEALVGVIAEAHRLGLKVLLDSPLNHFGYGDEVIFDGVPVQPQRRPDLFSQARNTESGDYHEVDTGKTEASILAAQDHLARLRLMELNDLEFSNPEVRRYLIESYKRFVDLGIDGFRLDAVKHLPRDFVAQFINEIGDYGRKSGKEITFLLELLLHQEFAFRTISNDIVRQINNPERVYFIDFLFQNEVRRFDRSSHSLAHFMGFVRHRQSIEAEARRLIPMLIDHDFAGPVADRFTELMMVAIAEFFSPHPLIVHHGSEEASVLRTSRQMISEVNAGAYKVQLQNLIRTLTAPLSATRQAETLVVHFESEHLLLVEHRGRDRSVFLAINQSRDEHLLGAEVAANAELTGVESVGSERAANVSLILDGSGRPHVKFLVPGRSLAVVDLKN